MKPTEKMLMRDLNFYSGVPISSSEARAILFLDRCAYDSYRASGILLQSIDLSLERPGLFQAHNFWDLIRFLMYMELQKLGIKDRSNLLSRIDSALDDIGCIVDHDFRDTSIHGNSALLLIEILQEHFPDLLSGSFEHSIVSRTTRSWYMLEKRTERTVRCNA